MSQFVKKHVIVFGISTQDVASHRAFAAKEHLNFPILADSQKKVTAEYDVLGANGMADRVTFIIGPNGRIRQIDREVNAEFQFRNHQLVSSRHGKDLVLALSNWKAMIGRTVPNFSLPDTQGRMASLLQPGHKASVLIYLSSTCPKDRMDTEPLKQLADLCQKSGVTVRGITIASSSINGRSDPSFFKRLSFPIMVDKGGVYAHHFGVRRSLTAYLVASDGHLLYIGGIGGNATAESPNSSIAVAIKDYLAGKPVPKSNFHTSGCPI